ncbi:MAG: TIGR00730 family Rossman fold protein [Flavipsychrobacter sp.]|nr:TIGR00730 family Rossman fold protein [Flavipsychrobacter sp.]
MIKSIAVFCGSSEGYDKVYMKAAREAGATLATRKIELIYGGSKAGLMGAIADGVLENGGIVTGVIPGFLKTVEIVHTGITELVTVGNMHERKLKMHELSDAVITMPGGWGTMEEFFEMLTWGQLGLHRKPIGLLNVNGYYDSLAALNKSMVTEGFLKENTANMLLISNNINDLLYQMEHYTAPEIPEWLTRQTT